MLEKRGSRLLLVEDDSDISEMLRAYFNIQGYEIRSVGFGADAVQLCRQERPDLVLLDVNLPDINGYEVCRQLKDDLRTSNIPVIFVSQRNQQEDKIHGLRMGGDDYITKPFNFDELRLRIQNTLIRSRYRRHVDPFTGQPSGTLIEEQLKALLHRSGWALLYVGIDDFDLFSDTYGFLSVRRILNFVATLLQQTAERLGNGEDFVGHVGKGDFVVITKAARAHEMASEVKSRFKRAVTAAYQSPKKPVAPSRRVVREQEPPALLMNLSIGIVVGRDGQFADIRTLAEVAAAARRQDRQARLMAKPDLPESSETCSNPRGGKKGSRR
ncbi:MAG: response regulator [Chloroflexota bacterium]